MLKTDKKIISILLILIMIVSQILPVLAADYSEPIEVKESYKTLEEYLKYCFITRKSEDSYEYIYNYDSEIYENTKKEDVRELYIWSTSYETVDLEDGTEELRTKNIKIENFDLLYELPNLEILYLSYIEDIQKIDFTKLPKLKEININKGTLNGKIDLSNYEDIELRINLDCDLTNAVIDLRRNRNIFNY